MRKGDPVFAWKLRMGARQGARSERKAPAEGGYEVWSTARECVVVTVICLSRARLTSAVCTLCMAGRRLEVREVSLKVRTSFPTNIEVILVAGR